MSDYPEHYDWPTCEHCGDAFKPGTTPHVDFCSEECYNEAHSGLAELSHNEAHEPTREDFTAWADRTNRGKLRVIARCINKKWRQLTWN